MKKLLFIVSALLLMGITAHADNPEVYIDNRKLETEAEPQNVDGHVLVPMRAIFESLGARVEWDGDERVVWAYREGQIVKLSLDTGYIGTSVNNSDGDEVRVDTIKPEVPAQIIDDFTYVPVRAISEMLSAYVGWDGEQNRVLIDSRLGETGSIYYSSDSDYQKLYSSQMNGLNRHKLSDRSVKDLTMFEGFVYYLDKDNGYLYRANNNTGEQLLLAKTIKVLDIEEGFIYYQELDGAANKYGPLYRFNLSTMESERLTDNKVQYPEKYRDRIYFNLDGRNEMFSVTKDGSEVHTLEIGGKDVSRLYPFNCMFLGDYIFVEDGLWYGNIVRMNLDGSGVTPLTTNNAIMFDNRSYTDKIIFLDPANGQDIYCMNNDGSDKHLVHKSNQLWVDVKILARWNDTIYYKNPMRGEVYRVNLDGSDDVYACYANEIKVGGDKLISSYNGLYVSSMDCSDMECIYDRNVKGFGYVNGNIFFKNADSSRLYISDMSGKGGSITYDSVGEWVLE